MGDRVRHLTKKHLIKKHRVVVTGMGVVAPIGQSVGELVDGLLSGRSGAGPISTFDPAALPTRIAAEVKWTGDISRDRKMSFAAEAARQAVDDALTCGSTPEPEGGLSLGIGLELFSMDDAIAKQAGGRRCRSGGASG